MRNPGFNYSNTAKRASKAAAKKKAPSNKAAAKTAIATAQKYSRKTNMSIPDIKKIDKNNPFDVTSPSKSSSSTSASKQKARAKVERQKSRMKDSRSSRADKRARQRQRAAMKEAAQQQQQRRMMREGRPNASAGTQGTTSANTEGYKFARGSATQSGSKPQTASTSSGPKFKPIRKPSQSSAGMGLGAMRRGGVGVAGIRRSNNRKLGGIRG